MGDSRIGGVNLPDLTEPTREKSKPNPRARPSDRVVTSSVDVVVVAYDPGPWLALCVRSALESRGVSAHVLVVDNGGVPPNDPVRSWPEVEFLDSATNVGFAAGANLGIASGTAPWVLCLNQDATVAPDATRRLVDLIASDPTVAAVAPKVLHRPRPDAPSSDRIDTAGLERTRSGRFVDIGQGDRDRGEYDGVREVFGVSAAAALYRRTALERVADGHGVFDGRFFMYKEDVDLAWRLRMAGYRALVDGRATAYHARSIRRSEGTGFSGLRRLLANERAKPAWVRTRSWQNQILMLVKNEDPETFFRRLPDLVAREIAQGAASACLAPMAFITGRLELLLALRRAVPDRLKAERPHPRAVR
jgi:GT2 family glycosyltransferase